MRGSKSRAVLLALLVLNLPAGLVARDEPEEVWVFAAASLRNVLQRAAEHYGRFHPGRVVVLNSAASGVLLRQIQHGAPADVFLSASPAELDRLDEEGLIEPRSRCVVASNRLVVVVPRGLVPPEQLETLLDPVFGRIAIGNPSTVPEGRYARQALQTLGFWEQLQPRLILAENARQVLDYVSRGEVDAALVYATDVRLLPGRVIAGAVAPAGSHATILYEGAVIAGAPHPDRGWEFLDFLTSDDGSEILTGMGFLPPPHR